MKVLQCAQAYREDEDELIFDHYLIILSQDTDLFIARSHSKVTVDQDIEALDCPLTLVPKANLYPPYTNDLMLAPDPLPNDTFLKTPSLFKLDETDPMLCDIVLHEARICELLSRHPHPNIARYLGCVQDSGLGLITSLCFVRYQETLFDRLQDQDRPLDLYSCLQGVKDGLDHLHHLGLNHNDINPSNIMLDQDDVPVIIDFDCCQREGEPSFGVGTTGWTDGSNTGLSERKNDEFALMQLYETYLKDA